MTSLEGWSSTIELRPQQPPRAERLSPRSVPSPARPPLQRVEPAERIEVILVQELDPQPLLSQRGDDLAQAVLELHLPRMLQGRPVGVGIGIVLDLGRGVEVV